MAFDKLSIELDARTDKLERAFANASSVAEKHTKKMSDAFSAVNASFAAIGISLSVGTFAAMIKGAIDAQDSLKDLSKSTSISIENLSGLSSAALKSGGDLESIAAAINKLSVNMGKEGEKFAALGVTAKDPIEAFKQLADVFVAIKDPQERAAVAAEALGKSWAGAAPLLSEGGAAIGEMVEKGRSLSKVTEESAAKADALNDKLVDLQTVTASLSTRVASALVPSLLETAQAIERVAGSSNAFLEVWRMFQGTIGSQRLSFDPGFASQEKYLEGLKTSLSDLQAKRDAFNPFIPWGDSLEEIDKKIVVTKNQLEAATKFKDKLSPQKPQEVASDSAVKPNVAAFLNPDKPSRSGGGRSSVKRETAYTDPLASTAEAYAKAIERINSALADAEKSTLSLNAAEQSLHDLMASSVWESMPQAWKDVVTAEAEASSAAIKAAEDQKRLNDLIAATPTAKLEEQQKTMRLLSDAFEAGTISAAQFDEATQTALGAIPDAAKDATNAIDEFANEAARNMQDAFADFLFDPFKDGVDGMALNFAKALQRMLANAAAANLAKAVFGDSDGSGLLGGLFSGLFGGPGSSSAAAAMEGGGSIYATAMTTLSANGNIMTDRGPLPLNKYANGGIASSPQVSIFGEGKMPEAYVPLPDGRSIPVTMRGAGNGSNVSINITVNEAQGASSAESSGDSKGAWAQFAGRVRAMVLEEMDNQKRPGGRLYA